jgi:hypothetical protein
MDVTITPADAEKYWDRQVDLLTEARAELGNETAFSVILSSTLNELRRLMGTRCAMQVVQDFVDLMPEAATFDASCAMPPQSL